MAAHGRLELISKDKASVGSSEPSSSGSFESEETGTGPISRTVKQAVPPCHYAVTKVTPIGYKQHVKAADATVAISRRMVPGNVLSLRNYADTIKKPCIVVQLGPYDPKYVNPVERIANWIRKNRFKSVNFAVSHQFWASPVRKAKTVSGDPWEPVIFLILNVSDALSDLCNLTQVTRIVRPRGERKSSKGRLYRHGDLLLRQIRRLPENLRAVSSAVLAAGEDTGHTHVLQPVNGSTLQVYRSKGGSRYFKTDLAVLTHQEHAPIAIEKGIYSVRREREYDYFSEDEELNWGEWADMDFGYDPEFGLLFWERKMSSRLVGD